MPGRPGSFKTPIRRRVKLRHIRDALRGRASLIPLRCPSSSPPQPLRWVAAGDPAFLKKRMRRARWKRKSLFAAQLARRASWRKCGGLPNRCRPDLPVSYRVRSTLAVVGTAPPQLAESRRSSLGGKSQGLSSYSRAFRFAMRYPGSPERTVPSFPQLPGCGSKKRRTEHPGGTTPPVFRDRRGAAAKENGGASGRDHTSGLP